MNEKLTVSVAMCTYNGERFLPEQLESLLQQKTLPDELVISDDGSVDNTLKILNEFAQKAPFPVRIIQNSKRKGVNLNFRDTILDCRKDIIFICDQDDIWGPEKISRSMAHFYAKPELQLVAVNALYIGPDGKLLPVEDMLTQREIVDQHFNKLQVGYLTSYNTKLEAGCSMAIRSGFAKQILSLEFWQGYDIWLSCMAAITGAPFEIEPTPLFFHRFHENNASWSLTNKKYVTKNILKQQKKENRKKYRHSIRSYIRHYIDYQNIFDKIQNIQLPVVDIELRNRAQEELRQFIAENEFRIKFQTSFCFRMKILFFEFSKLRHFYHSHELPFFRSLYFDVSTYYYNLLFRKHCIGKSLQNK